MSSELKTDLTSFGYADGGYMSKCSHCKETFLGAKRAWSCEPCAIKKSIEPKITRAVPDVPELVRYAISNNGGRYFGMAETLGGEYVLHSQAAAVIAEMQNKLSALSSALTDQTNYFISMSERAKAAEAERDATRDDRFDGLWRFWNGKARELTYENTRLKTELAKLKAQEPVGWIHIHQDFNTEFSKQRLTGEDFDRGFREEAVYAAPVADSLKAENERLMEALKDALAHLKPHIDVNKKHREPYETALSAYDRGIAALNVDGIND